MKQKISLQEAKKIMEVKGKTRGITIKGKIEFIVKEKGKDALKKIEDVSTELGYPIKYDKLKPNDFYPAGYETLTLLIANKAFNLGNEKITEMGSFVPKLIFVMRVFMRYFSSIELIAREASNLWKRYYTIGSLKVKELNKEKKYAILQMESPHLHHLHCEFFKGYFATTVQMVVKTNVTCKEKECSFKGGKTHEFLLQW